MDYTARVRDESVSLLNIERDILYVKNDASVTNFVVSRVII